MSILDWILYLILYFGAGASLKIGDDFLDELDLATFAGIPLGMAGILFGVLMSVSEWDLVLFSAIIIGVLVSGKVNDVQYIVGFVAITGILVIMSVPTITDWFGWVALLIMLLMAAVLDEQGNDWADKSITPRASKFFQFRLTLKVSVLLLSIPWPLFIAPAIGLWFFDSGYELVGWSVRKRINQSSDTQDYSIHP
ncbi:MAG: hypothetical protein RTU30_08565 [Candidatus Thorarchaeota archaeon]